MVKHLIDFLSPNVHRCLILYSILEDMLFTPFPRPKYRAYVIIGVIIGVSIAFILNVLQPFGTDSFQHPYKHLILSGYGIVSVSAVALYFFISLNFVSRRLEDKWNILYESLDFFSCVLFSMMACYVYFILIFDYTFRVQGLLEFLTYAVPVSLLPTIAVLVFLYFQYKGVIRSYMILGADNRTGDKSITLTGSNKSDRIETTSAQINFVKAEDNYVIIHLTIDSADQKHMIRSTLKQIYNQLSHDSFYQCHRSYIVNKNKVLEIAGNKNSAKILLNSDGLSVPLSRSNYDHIRDVIQK